MSRNMVDSGVEWIGKIPEGWKVVRLKSLFNFGKGLPITKENLAERGVPVISYGQIHAKFNTGVELTPELYRFVPESYLTSNPESLVNRGDFIFADTSEDLDGCGNCAYIHEQKKLFAGYHTIIFHSKVKKDSKYLAYLFKTDAWRSQLRSKASGVKLFSISRKMLGEASVLYPDKESQKRITDFLDKKCSAIDDVLAKTQESIEEYKKLKQAVITEAVTKGVRGKRPMKDSGIDWIGQIPKDWDAKRFRYIADALEKGNGITKDEVFSDGETPCVRYGEIYTKYNQAFTTCVSRTKKDALSTLQYFDKGNILFVGTGELVEEIGKSVVYLGDEKCLAGGDIIIAKHSQNPSFLNYALNSQYAQVQKSCGKTKLKVVHISASELKNVLIFLPSKEEQQEIADYLDKKCAAIDTLISKKRQFIEELTAYKKSLIYEYVTGKKEVPA